MTVFCAVTAVLTSFGVGLIFGATVAIEPAPLAVLTTAAASVRALVALVKPAVEVTDPVEAAFTRSLA